MVCCLLNVNLMNLIFTKNTQQDPLGNKVPSCKAASFAIEQMCQISSVSPAIPHCHHRKITAFNTGVFHFVLYKVI